MWSVSAKYAAPILRTRATSSSVIRIAAAASPTVQQMVLRWSTASASSDSNDWQQGASFEKLKKPFDAFAVLNVDRKFDIPQEEVKQSYRKLMSHLHPDKHHGKSTAEQEALAQRATEVTQSYQILKQDTTRATHMLQLLGKVEDTFDESSLQELMGTSPLRNILLMEVMEIREAIDDAGSDQEELRSLLEENAERMEDVCANLASAFKAEDLDKAVEFTVMLQYYGRIEEAIREKLEHE